MTTTIDDRAVPTPGAGWTQRSDRTFNDTRQLVSAAISATLPKGDDGEPAYVWVCDLTDEWAVYEFGGGDYMQVTYSVDVDNNVTLGEPVAVAQVTTYEPKGVPAPARTRPRLAAPPAREPREVPTEAERRRIAAGRRMLYRDELRSEARGFNEPWSRCVRQMDPTKRVAMPFEMREVPNGTGGTSLLFSGYACVVEQTYEMEDMFGPYTETVQRSAFQKTLAENPDVNFLCNHTGVSMARTKPGTLTLASDATGLYNEARLNLTRSDVQIVRAAVEDGDLDEQSFAFRCTRQEWDEDFENRIIQEVSLHQGDVSVVNYGANPHTAGLVAIRSKYAALRGISTVHIADLLREIRAGKTLSADTTNVLKQVLGLVSDADDSVDQAQIMLAQLMGVPNPDDDSQWTDTTAAGDPNADDASSENLGAWVPPDQLSRAKQRLARAKGEGR